MKSESKHLLVTLADRNFLNQARQLFSSVYWHAGWQGDYMLLAHDVPEKELDWFRNKGILIYNCSPLDSGMIANDSLPATVLAKFYLFTEYFRQWKKVIFLDADIIVRASLDKLTLATGLSVASDMFQGTLRQQFEPRASGRLFAELEQAYKLDIPSFNSGVLAFNTDIITADLFPQLVELYKRFGALSLYGEQGVINLAFYGRWNRISKMYNFTLYDCDIFKVKRGDLRAIMIHFIGQEKPWIPGNPFYQLWWKNLALAENIDLFTHYRRRRSGRTGKSIIILACSNSSQY